MCYSSFGATLTPLPTLVGTPRQDPWRANLYALGGASAVWVAMGTVSVEATPWVHIFFKSRFVGSSVMWCLRMWGLKVIVYWPSTTEGVRTSHLTLIWVRGSENSILRPTSWNTTSLNTQVCPPTKRSSGGKYHWHMKLCWKMLLRIHWKMPMEIHDAFWGVDFWCAIFRPCKRRSSGPWTPQGAARSAAPRRAAARHIREASKQCGSSPSKSLRRIEGDVQDEQDASPQAFDLLSASGLDHGVLKQIWDLADPSGRGSTYLSTYPPIHLSTYLSIYLSTYLPICQSYLSTYLPIYLYLYMI